MFKIARPFFLQVVTPLHAGCGSELGVVDLPIQRERHTGFPKIESSGLKGCIREAFEEKEEKIGRKKQELLELFGPEDEEARDNPHSGAMGFVDARILLFPVKSMKGVYALTTCPSVIQKFLGEIKLCSILGEDIEAYQKGLDDGAIANNKVSNASHISVNDSVYLEEYAFPVKEDGVVKTFASWLAGVSGLDAVKDKLVILSDNDFRDFVNISTEVITRTKIDNETGTVKEGALFTEEYLPSETLMYSLALATKIFKKDENQKSPEFKAGNGKTEDQKIMDYFCGKLPPYLQLGGNATLGKGIVKTRIMGGAHNG
jgi:CRISPR-associated protein Cmr4